MKILPVKKLHPDAIIPSYATPGAACFDLHAVVMPIGEGWHPVAKGQPATIRTGLAFEVPKDHVMLVFSRSGHGFKNDIRLANCVGVIDSDYRGELQVKLTSDNTEGRKLDVKHGDRIAQAMIIRADQYEFLETDTLSDTVRGEAGLGSTGV